MTFGEAAAIHLRNLDDNLSIKPRTRDYWRERLAALIKSWPGLNETEVRKITQADCKKWASTYAKMASPTRYNNTVARPSTCFERRNRSWRDLQQSRSGFETCCQCAGKKSRCRAIGQIQRADCGDARGPQSRFDQLRGLRGGPGVTGCRKGEANAIAWRDVDFEAGEIVVRGDAETGTKNWELRRVPLIPDARALFERMRSERTDEPLDAKVFRVRECQKSLDRACKKVGTDRITHHDLRHLFATRCIESGVDIPTVSRWLGHKDGGALAMKTYGHLRREHSIAQAQRVSFAPVATKAGRRDSRFRRRHD